MKVVVCGGRDYRDRAAVYAFLDKLHAEHGITLIIHGDASGADRLGRDWAVERGIPHRPFPADWSKGCRAGFRRNRQMLTEGNPDLIVAFPGGRGTTDMILAGKTAGVTVITTWRTQ